MSFIKKLITFGLAAILSFGLVACSGSKEYIYEKESEKMVRFSSSDKVLDDFLNDYLHRHLRYDEYAIGSLELGNSALFNKEWEALALYWFDCTSNVLKNDRIEAMRNYLNNMPVDKYGYVWSSFDELQPFTGSAGVYFGQGWPHPSYLNSFGNSQGFEFNGGAGEKEWTVEGASSSVVKEGYLRAEAVNTDLLTFTSPVFDFPIYTKHAPFLEIDLRLLASNISSDVSDIEDIYVYWKNSASDSWSEDKKVSYKEFSTMPEEITAGFAEWIYFPMYLHPQWGTDKEVEQLKIEIKAKSGETFNATAFLNFVRGNYDTRQSNNIALLLRTAELDYKFTGDVELLERNLNRYRSAMQFMLTHLKGETGLLDLSYFVGHEGRGGLAVGESIFNSYWDMLPNPPVSMSANVYFYRALKSMAYLEQAAEDAGIELEMPEVVGPSNVNSEKVKYQQTPETLLNTAEKVKKNLQAPIDETACTGFWDEDKGRFIEGFNVDGEKIDYGYIMYNLDLVSEGIATDEQAKRVMDWINGDVIIEGDTATGKYGKDGELGIYDLEFAPRMSTVDNNSHFFWTVNVGDAFGDSVQDGGVNMFVSYYDIMSRLDVRGADDAFGRLKEINQWYNKVQNVAEKNGVGTDLPNTRFYREYFDELGYSMQGGGSVGGIGLDEEFLESALLYAVVPNGFFGLDSPAMNTLGVKPNLPSALSFWKIENLLFHNIRYDLTIGKDFVQIDGVRGATEGKKIQVSFALPDYNYEVVSDNATVLKTEVVDGRLVVEVPFAAQRVQIIKK